jgi:hypothetical protein
MLTGQTAKVWPVFISSIYAINIYRLGLLRNVTKYVSLQCFSEYRFDWLADFGRHLAIGRDIRPYRRAGLRAAMRVARACQRGARTTAPTTSKSRICAG